jgi:hypothetical protein
MYFCTTQIGMSIINAIKFQSHKNIHDNKGDSRTNQKKNIIVKWNNIHKNHIKMAVLKRFFNFISFLFSIVIKFDIFT